MRGKYIHFMGALVVLSVIYNSYSDIISLLVVIPVFITSAGVWEKVEEVKIGGLVGTTLFISYLVEPSSMNDIWTLLTYIISTVLPILAYWMIVLKVDLFFDLKASIAASTYFVSTMVLFYSILILTEVDEYLLEAGNNAPQSLVLTAVVLLLFIPFNALADR